MKKITTSCLVGLFAFFSTTAFAADDMMKGELYGIVSKNKKVTEAYCKSHAIDTYKGTAEQLKKEVTAANGVKAKNLEEKKKEEGGLYFYTGKSMFSGKTDGKAWEEKVYYFGQSVEEKGAVHGVWYTKDCKGFYKVTPAS